jgi:hypothetical protein
LAELLSTHALPSSNLKNFVDVSEGNRIGQHSVRINDRWRICFAWREGGPSCKPFNRAQHDSKGRLPARVGPPQPQNELFSTGVSGVIGQSQLTEKRDRGLTLLDPKT